MLKKEPPSHSGIYRHGFHYLQLPVLVCIETLDIFSQKQRPAKIWSSRASLCGSVGYIMQELECQETLVDDSTQSIIPTSAIGARDPELVHCISVAMGVEVPIVCTAYSGTQRTYVLEQISGLAERLGYRPRTCALAFSFVETILSQVC